MNTPMTSFRQTEDVSTKLADTVRKVPVVALREIQARLQKNIQLSRLDSELAYRTLLFTAGGDESLLHKNMFVIDQEIASRI